MAAWILCVSVGIGLLVSGTAGSECCLAHTGDVESNNRTETNPSYTTVTQGNEVMWCKDYCCYKSSNGTTRYYCCDNMDFRAESSERTWLCVDYFRQNTWIVIIMIIAVVFLVSCCICFCCCCCDKKRCCKAYVHIKFRKC